LSQKVNRTIYGILSFKVVGAGHARENMEQVIVVAGMARLLRRCNLRFAEITFKPMPVSLWQVSVNLPNR
jgi:hypothetical protein